MPQEESRGGTIYEQFVLSKWVQILTVSVLLDQYILTILDSHNYVFAFFRSFSRFWSDKKFLNFNAMSPVQSNTMKYGKDRKTKVWTVWLNEILILE